MTATQQADAIIWAMPCSVLIVDDHPGFRAQARALLPAADDHRRVLAVLMYVRNA